MSPLGLAASEFLLPPGICNFCCWLLLLQSSFFCQLQWRRKKSKLPRKVAGKSSLPTRQSSNSLAWHKAHNNLAPLCLSGISYSITNFGFCISPTLYHFMFCDSSCPFRPLYLSTCSSLFLQCSTFSPGKNTTYLTSPRLDTTSSLMPFLTSLSKPEHSLPYASIVSTHIHLI